MSKPNDDARQRRRQRARRLIYSVLELISPVRLVVEAVNREALPAAEAEKAVEATPAAEAVEAAAAGAVGAADPVAAGPATGTAIPHLVLAHEMPSEPPTFVLMDSETEFGGELGPFSARLRIKNRDAGSDHTWTLIISGIARFMILAAIAAALIMVATRLGAQASTTTSMIAGLASGLVIAIVGIVCSLWRRRSRGTPRHLRR